MILESISERKKPKKEGGDETFLYSTTKIIELTTEWKLVSTLIKNYINKDLNDKPDSFVEYWKLISIPSKITTKQNLIRNNHKSWKR